MLLILTLSFSACSKGTEESSKSTSVDTSGPKKIEETKSEEEKKPVELTVEVFERSVAGQLPADDNWNTDYIKENLKKEFPYINVTYVPVPRTQEKEKLNILMAAGDAPDICVTYDEAMLYNYIQQGGVHEIGEYIDQYGATLKDFLGETLNYGVFDGKQYAVPAKRVLLAKYGSFLRKDWLDKVGLDMPTTTEEFYSMLKAFKEMDPGNLGDSNIPFALTMNYSVPEWPAATLLQSFITEMTEEEFYTLPQWLKPGYKEGMRFLNKLFNEGLINKDFPLDKDSATYKELISQGKVGSFINDSGLPLGSGGILESLEKNVPGAELAAMDPFKNYEGKTAKEIYSPVGIFAFVPKTCEHPAEAIIYLDFISRQDVRFALQNGVEGVNYELNEDGIPIPLEAPEGDRKAMSPASIDTTLTINGSDYGDAELNVKAASLRYTNPVHRQLYIDQYNLSIKDGYYQPRFDRPILAESKYSGVLLQVGSEMFAKTITCKPGDFDKLYDEYVQEYLDKGGQEVIDEKIEAYKAMKGN